MTLTSLLPVLAGILFLAFTAVHALRPSGRIPWWLPALGSLAFFAFSAYAIAAEGPTGFWTEHTRNLWGNQIWFDLLLAASIGWVFMVPRAKAVGMRPLPWLLALAATGSIGFLAMLARLLYLEARAERRA